MNNVDSGTYKSRLRQRKNVCTKNKHNFPKKTRQYFNDVNKMYTTDAKKYGNVSKFINHSCDPNLRVQIVFHNSHDLRFPLISFYSSMHILAGTELTWDYGYKISSVPKKVLQCHCGSSNCRGRLL